MQTKPNIVIFNPDQWRGDVMGHMGNPAAVTPNLDRLVSTDAVSFRNAYCQNPVCTPSRCSFMSGWYPHTRGHRTMHYMLRDNEGEENLLRTLRDNGYFVYWGGKNDLVPGQHGFAKDADIKFSPTDEDYQRWGHTPRPGLHGWTPWRGEPGSDTYYSFMAGKLPTDDDDIYCDGDWAQILGAIDFISSYEGEQPVCIYLPLLYPHPPYGVEEPWFSAIPRDRLPARAPAPESWDDKPSILQGIYEGQNLQGWTEDRWTELRTTYYGMCARLDHQFGLLIDALRDKGMYDDSAVFLFSDHGDFTGDYGLVEKTQNTLEDVLTHVPFVVKPPSGVTVQPRVSEAMVELVDFPATVYALTGIEPPHWHFGRSLLPVVAGESDEHRDAVFSEGGRLRHESQADEHESTGARNDGASHYWPRIQLQIDHDHDYHGKAAMCRTTTHKYVRRLYEKDELYDLRADPLEQWNLIDDPAYADVLLSLKERMLQWYQETADVVPLVGDRR